MRNVKRISLVVLLFAVIMVSISMFLPSSFHLERRIVIDADREIIFKQVNELKNWKNWSPWAVKDAGIYEQEGAYSTPSNGLGATFKWDSDNGEVGSGKMEIITSTRNVFIQTTTEFGFVDAVNDWNFNPVEDGVEAVWSIDIDFGFNPISKFFGLFMEEKIAPDFELGLERLKTFSENLPKIHTVEVKKELMPVDLWFLSVRDTVSQHEMNNIHGKIYESIAQYLETQNIVSSAPPLVIYHSFNELIDMEVGIPVEDSTLAGTELIKMNKIGASFVVTAIHYGPYDRMPETYFGINEWMRKNKVVVTGPPWESYLTDPTTEPDPEKWKTAISIPIE